MSTPETKSPELMSAAYWDADAGPRWVRSQELMDAVLAPYGEVLLASLGELAGRRVVDVGCGCGALSLELARRGARVTGVDVSRPMLARARERAAAEGLSIPFVRADAETHALDEPVDLVVSRFGVMFFADPARAFQNLAGWLAPGGEVGFLTWQEPRSNPWMADVQAVVGPWIDAPPPDPTEPGPFSLADAGRTRALLEGAGLSEVHLTALDVPMRVPGPPEVAVDFYLDRSVVEEAMARSEEAAVGIRAGVAALVDRHHDGAAFERPSASWLVRGRLA